MALPAEKLLAPVLSVNAALARVDPTRTLFLRNRWAREMRVRFNRICALVRRAVVDQDCFGLMPPQGIRRVMVQEVDLKLPHQAAFAFPRSADKVDAFTAWLQEQTQAGILELTTIPQLGQAVEQPWTNVYVKDSYARGIQRARWELAKAGYEVAGIEATGGIAASLAMPFHVDRLGLLYSRTFSELKGVTAAMDQQISRVLAQAVADGEGPRQIARLLVSTINGEGMGDLALTDKLGRFIPARARAEMIARTEVIRSFHQANVQEMMNYGVAGVYVKAEYMTAGDGRVCPRCASLQGKIYDLQEAMNLIPKHPRCRCVVLPKEVEKQ